MAVTGGKLGGLLMGWARPRVAPRVALSREYERQGGEKRHGREGRAPGARPERRMGSLGAAEPRGQPRHRQQQEEEDRIIRGQM